MVKFAQVMHNSQETLFIPYYTVYIYSNKTDNLGMLASDHINQIDLQVKSHPFS